MRGIYIFDVEMVAEAAAHPATDPAIVAGRLVMELHPWYGPASLREVPVISGKITRSRVSVILARIDTALLDAARQDGYRPRHCRESFELGANDECMAKPDAKR